MLIMFSNLIPVQHLLVAFLGVSTTLAADASAKYSILMAKSIVSRNQGILDDVSDRSAHLQAGFVQTVLDQVLIENSAYGDVGDIRSHYVKSVDSVVTTISDPVRDLTFPLDRLRNGPALIKQYNKSKNQTYRTGYEALRKSIDLNPRNSEGGLIYYVYPHWSYLDGMYSFAPFLLDYTLNRRPVNHTAIADIILQLDLLWHHTYNATSGFLVHGYDASKTAVWANRRTGASPHVWGRSLGWYYMALVDTYDMLPAMPAFHYPRGWLEEHIRSLSSSIVDAVDPVTGAWWQVHDAPGRKGNYIESSASSMFAYGLLKAVRVGVLDDDLHYGKQGLVTYSGVAKTAYEYIVKNFVVRNGNGTVGWGGTVGVCSLNSTASYDYYVGQPIVYNSVLGSAAFVLASLEYEGLA